ADEFADVVTVDEARLYAVAARAQAIGEGELFRAHRDDGRLPRRGAIGLAGAHQRAIIEAHADLFALHRVDHAAQAVALADESGDEQVRRALVEHMGRRALLHHALVEHGDAVA